MVDSPDTSEFDVVVSRSSTAWQRPFLQPPETARIPHLAAHAQTRVSDRQDGYRDGHHGPVQHHEHDLVVGQSGAEAVAQLSHAVATADQDADSASRYRYMCVIRESARGK